MGTLIRFRLRTNIFLSACLLAALSTFAVAQGTTPGPDPHEVIAYQGDVVLTQREIDAAFSKLPEGERLSFIRDGSKVDQLIRVLLRRKSIAADAVKAGFDQDTLVATRMQLEAEKELAEAWMQNVMAEMPEADYEALAREDYLANPDHYRSETVLDVSHILIGTESRTEKEARELAHTIGAWLQQDPSRFDQLVMEYSDDPAKLNNGGRYREMRRGMMVAPFENAAFKLQETGAISKMVETSYGFHFIRLNGRSGNDLQDYDEVKKRAVAEARQRHIDNYRENYLRRVQADTIVIPDESVEIMAKRHFGENLELAPGRSQ